MTADQRERSIGRLLPAEGSLGHFGHFADAPFPNGVLNGYSREDSRWTVNNDGSLITFTHTGKDDVISNRHRTDIINKFWDYPVLGGVFTSRKGSDSSGEPNTITTIPTVVSSQ